MHFRKVAALAFVLAAPLGCAESGMIEPIGTGGVGAGSSHRPPNGGNSGTTPKGGTGGGGTGGTTAGGTAGTGALAGTGGGGTGGSSGASGTGGSSGSGGAAGASGSAGEAGAGGGTCVGAPYPCEDLGASDCAVASGCTLAGACNNPFCANAEDSLVVCGVLAIAGVPCSFDNTKPTGNHCFFGPCAGGTDEASCSAIPGCAFTGGCSGTPDDCATLGRTACQNQLGCSWE